MPDRVCDLDGVMSAIKHALDARFGVAELGEAALDDVYWDIHESIKHIERACNITEIDKVSFGL